MATTPTAATTARTGTGQNQGQAQGRGGKGGQSNRRQKKITEYGLQLIEKQKTKQSYGLREKQFRRYFQEAGKFRGQTGQMLLQLLERRLDNVIFRSGLAKTRAQARQLVSHRHFLLNGTRVSIPSHSVGVGDVVTPYKKNTVTYNAELVPITWIKTDKKELTATIERLPTADDLPIEFDTQKIIEFYSR